VPRADVAVRAAMPADVPAMARLHVDSWQATYSDVFAPETFAEFSLAAREAMWGVVVATMHERGDERLQLLVAQRHDVPGELAGFIAGGPFRAAEGAEPAPPGSGEVRALYLAPALQRQGIGRSLFDAGCAWLRKAGFVDMKLWVIDGNPAMRFYEAMGCAFVERTHFASHGRRVAEICYHRSL
jgi:GNAT superfamily N-acetyltransferase